MRVVGIVAEFNPFHNGHEYLIKKAREIVNDPRAIVMPVMSGFFTQRGLPAICPPSVRAKQALLSGADVVLELPFSFSCAPSSRFAEGAISELVSTGVITDIAFGVDTDDTELLKKLANLNPDDEEFNSKLNEYISTGISFPEARAKAIKDIANAKGIDDDLDQVLSSPNSILALDYLLALKKIDKMNRINVIMIKREGDGYHAAEAGSSFASATTIRRLISETAPCFSRSEIAAKLNGLMPDLSLGIMLSSNSGGTFEFPDYVDYIRDCMLTVSSAYDVGNAAYMTDDLSGYIRNFACDIRPDTISGNDPDLRVFESRISTKRYTLSRIYRALASLMAGQDNSCLDIKRPPYIRVLGFNQEGKYCLKIMGKCAKVPVINRPSDCLELQSENKNLKKIFELDMRAASLGWKIYGRDIATEWESIPVIVK
ncbi:putative nucleotidyltransferase [Ruminococcaceae bacterium R-25]|nr:putative nucleotidyltransferase [Ruminococcaceae bacterium R-25]SUQ21949.1 Predicted nucleotidyltransferase [Oscillospiraceae bacterium]